MNAHATSAEVSAATRLVSGAEAAALIGRAVSCRYAAGFPKPVVLGRGPRPNLYDPTAVKAWAKANPPGTSRCTSEPSAPAPKPKVVEPVPVYVEAPTRYVLPRLNTAGGLLQLPDEAARVRSLVRDVNDGPCRRPRPDPTWRTFLRDAKADGVDAPAALLDMEARRDRRRVPSVHGGPSVASSSLRPL